MHQRWSEPPQLPSICNSLAINNGLPFRTSRSGFNTAQAHDTNTSEQRASETSLSESGTSFEKSALQRSGTAYSNYSLELASSESRGDLPTDSWRPSYFRTGPMVGLTVRSSKLVYLIVEVNRHRLMNEAVRKPLAKGDLTNGSIFLPVGTLCGPLADSSLVHSLAGLEW